MMKTIKPFLLSFLLALVIIPAQVSGLVDSLSLRTSSIHRPTPKRSSKTERGSVVIIDDRLTRNTAPATTLVHPTKTWKRRLDTKQDSFDIHKWAGFGWWVSATAIFGTGTLSGFTDAPPVLEWYTYLFLVATLIQAVSSIPMAIKYRPNEKTVQRGFISSAIASSSSAIVGVWLSPYCNEAVFGPSVVAALVGALVVADTLYSMTSFEDIQAMLQEFQVQEMERAEVAGHKVKALYSTLLPTIPWALPLNLILLHEMIHHSEDMRHYFVETIVAHGSSLDLVYYASLVTSIAVSVGNLAATLRHRKLISKDVEDVAMIGSWVVTFVFNLKAAGMY